MESASHATIPPSTLSSPAAIDAPVPSPDDMVCFLVASVQHMAVVLVQGGVYPCQGSRRVLGKGSETQQGCPSNEH